jgi:hypothetical protein
MDEPRGDVPMNYVTFKIKETKDGQFVLKLHNHHQQKVYETFRSKDLDEVVSKLKKEMEYRRRLMNALINYAPVMDGIDRLESKYQDASKETFPDGWTDSLDLYGAYRKELDKPGADLDQERADLKELLDEKGPEWVWQNRQRLAAERVFIREF